MAKPFFKRPSSGRRNIKQETFSKYISSNRLRRIQSLLHESSAGDSGPNAVLCILGIDGRYNDGCKELADYLLFDFFQTQRTDIERSGLPEERIDDMIFCIRPDAVEVYCNPINIHYLTPYIIHWRNLRLHCMKDADYEDDEAAEEFKIKSLVSMVDGCNTIGIPYYRIGQKQTFDKMLVEKWPIIQAFALEGFGSGGFFTMNHEVTDISGALWQIYQEMDPCVLEAHITEQLPLLERQWRTMMTVIDVAKFDGLPDVNEGTVAEPLRSYFNHGIATANNNKQSTPCRRPFVLFGVNSCRKTIENANATPSKSSNAVNKSGLRGGPALHMVCQMVSPKAPYSCTRTYFFGTPTPVHPSFASKGSESKSSPGEKDLRLLNSLYIAVVSAIQTAMKVYSGTLSVHQAEDEAMNVLSKLTKTFVSEPLSILAHLADSKNVKFSIEAQDTYNRRVDLIEGKSSPHVKLAGLTVYDIPSVEHEGEILGSVVFSESFLDSTIPILRPDGSIDIDGEHTVLTSNIPHHSTWPYVCGSNESYTHIQYKVAGTHISGFGRALIQGDSTYLLSDNTDLPPLRDGQTYLYEEGLVFLHSQNSPVIIPKNQLQSIQLYDGDSPSVVALIIMQYKPTLQQYLPQQLWSDNRMVLLAFYPKSKAYKKLFSEVLHKWKSSRSVPMQVLGEELPDVLTDVHSALQREYKTLNVSNPSKLTKAKSKISSLTRYFEHFEASCCLGSVPVPQSEMLPILGLPYDVGSFDDSEEMIITILGGIPGSHKENLCTTLTNLAKDDNRWAIIRTPPEKSTTFNPGSLQQKLAAVIQASMKKRAAAGASKKKRRVLLVTPGFTDIVDVVQAIVSHPNKDIARKLKIGAVTVCVDSTNTYITDRCTFPRLLDQCAEGWVNNIVFTNSSSTKPQEVENAQKLIRAANSDVALMIAEFGEVTRTPDIELILSESAFSEGSLVRARHLSCPGWTIGKYRSGKVHPPFNDIILQFSQPLDRVNLINNLKALKKSHVGYPFTGNIYHLRGRIKLTDSDTMYELQYAVTSGYHSLVALDAPAPDSVNGGVVPNQFVVAITGCELKEDQVRDWLRSCARQKPTRKENVARNDLTKAQIKKIQMQHRLDALPEGWFYNGNKYISLGGERADMHPDIENFIEDHLKAVNIEVDKYNEEIELETYQDVFSA